MSADDTNLTLRPDQGVPDKLMARSISPVSEGTPNDETHLTHDPSSSVKRDSSSASTSPKESGMQTPASRSTPPSVPSKRTKPPKPPATGPQLIGHLPKAEEEARATFIEIPENIYQYSTLGRSREALESMMCDCQYEHGVDSPSVACGEGSECINRLTQVECMPDECRCLIHCRNQRFQQKQYAPIDIVLTEKKGFGLRAAGNLPRDAFIYEYVGDVLSSPSMKKRMREYGKEGIRHFYFMMLQKDEFIDATKKGGIGRFANHSCNPNCYVAKWTIGDRVRMGIFSKRAVLKGEELTFNYNVDRYGHEAQQCFCGEPNCVGYIGGKTQTDLAAMDDLYIDALGISDEVEKLGLKGSKKKKSRKLDEDYAPILKPLQEKDVPKVIQAIRQTSSRKVLSKLLTRIKITEDKSPLRQLMRLRGFSLMTNILQDYSSDSAIQILVMECVSTWPLLQRNKIEDSKINIAVQAIADAAAPDDEANTHIESERTPKPEEVKTEPLEPTNLESTEKDADEPQQPIKSEDAESADAPVLAEPTNGVIPMAVDESNVESERGRTSERHESQTMKLKRLATKLLEEWATLETGYRIPKRLNADADNEPVRDPTPPPVEEERPYKRAKVLELEEPTLNWLPTTATATAPPTDRGWGKMPGLDGWIRPRQPEPSRKGAIEAVIAAARAAAVAAALQKAEEEARELAMAEEKSKLLEKKQAKEREKKKPGLSKEEKEELKEKKLKKMVGAVVVKTMSKYQKYMDHEQFKKYAKELTEVIAEKEKKSSSYKEGKLDAFSEEKAAKIKKFAKEYIAKVIRKIKEKRRKKQQQHQRSASASTPAPGSASCSRRGSLGGGDVDLDDLDAEGEGEEMNAEVLKNMIADAIGFGGDDDGENRDDEGDDMDIDIDDQEPGADDGDGKHQQPAGEENSPDDTDMVVTPIQVEIKDPRLRLRMEGDGDGESGWAMNQIINIRRSFLVSVMEPTKVLTSGLTLEESKAKRQEKQAARYRHRLGTYVPSGDSKGLLEALMATSPRKSPTPRKSMKPRKSIKSSTERNSGNEVADKSTQEVKGRPKPRKATSRKSTKAADLDEVNQVKRSDNGASRRSVSRIKTNTVEDEVEEPGPSTSRGTRKTTIVNSKAAKSSKKSATTKNPKRSKPSSRTADAETDLDNQPIAPEPPKVKAKKSSTKPPPTQTDDESDDLAIKKMKAPKKVDKGKARAVDSPAETFESAGTDADSHLGPPDPLSAEGKALCDLPPDVHGTTTTQAIPRVASNPGDIPWEGEELHNPPSKKRGRPRNDEGGGEPPPKRGKTQKSGGEGEDSTIKESGRQSKKSSTKARSTTIKGRTRKKMDHPPVMSDAEGGGSAASETRVLGSDTRKRQQRKIDNGSDDEKQNKTDRDEASLNPNRVRLDNIPPEGIVIRKKNGIVEKLLPPTNKPKKKTRSDNGRTRGSRKRAIPVHLLKYIGPTRIGSPLKGEGTDTDDDLNL